MNDSNVSLQISKEIVNPIIEAKVKEAVLAALGGKENVIEMVLDNIMNKKVDKSGKVSSYSSDNKFSWLDIAVTNQVEQAVRSELTTLIAEKTSVIKEEVVRILQTKKGASSVAQCLLDALNGTLKNSWTSTVNVSINSSKKDC